MSFFQISCPFSKYKGMRKAVTCLTVNKQHCQKCQIHFSLKSNNVMVWHRPVQTKQASFLLEHSTLSSFFQKNLSSIGHMISTTSHNSLVPNSPLVKEQKWTKSIPASTLQYSCRRFSNETEHLHSLCTVDKYNGITVDLNDLPQDFSVEKFHQVLTGKII